MEPQIEIKLSSRPKFRSYKYSVAHPKLDYKFQHSKTQLSKQRSRSIINVDRLDSLSKFKKASLKQNLTIDATNAKQPYLKTFLSLINQECLAQKEFNLQNQEDIVFFPRYNSAFQRGESDFTMLDVIKKPIEYIQSTATSSMRQLKSQKNHLELLRSELNTIKCKILGELNQIDKETKAKIEAVVKEFHHHEVNENQRRLRHRKQIKLMKRNIYLFGLLQQRSRQIQQSIFDSHPFDFDIKTVGTQRIGQKQQ